MPSHPEEAPSRHVRRGTIFRAGTAISVFLVALVFGRYTLATTFRAYDDEGYILLSLDHYLGGGHLYTEVFSQYGPFYFFAERALFRLLQLPVNHDAGRLVTLICWLLSAGLAGYFIYKVSRNMILASAAGLAAMSLASVLANEPGHPQQVILPILMLACCASVTGGPSGLLLLGALGAALSLTKINVGVFYFVAVAFTLVCRFPTGRLRTLGTGFLLAYAVGFPIALMHRDVLGWARGYCLIAILCGVSTFVAGLLTTPSSRRPMRSVLYVVLGAVLAAMFVVIGTMWQGMSLSTLLEGILGTPLKHPGVFEIPLMVSKIRVLFAVLVFVCIALLFGYRDRWRAYSDRLDALRCVTGLCVIAVLTAHQSPAFIVTFLPYVAIFLPLGLIPTGDRLWPQSDCLPRLFVTSLAATQFLQPYPVAGSQLNIAAAPLLLWAFFCVHDGADGLFRLVPRTREWLGETFPKESVLGGLVVLPLAVAMLRSGIRLERHSAPPSSLRGATSLHLPPEVEATYQFLANNIRANCDVLFTMPGMGSLNFWSGVPTPNGLNLTAWMKGLNPEQQRQILEALQINPRACVVYNPDRLRGWGTTAQDLDELPLARYVLYDMPKISQKQGYEIRVHPQRTSPWIEVGARSSP